MSGRPRQCTANRESGQNPSQSAKAFAAPGVGLRRPQPSYPVLSCRPATKPRPSRRATHSRAIRNQRARTDSRIKQRAQKDEDQQSDVVAVPPEECAPLFVRLITSKVVLCAGSLINDALASCFPAFLAFRPGCGGSGGLLGTSLSCVQHSSSCRIFAASPFDIRRRRRTEASRRRQHDVKSAAFSPCCPLVSIVCRNECQRSEWRCIGCGPRKPSIEA